MGGRGGAGGVGGSRYDGRDGESRIKSGEISADDDDDEEIFLETRFGWRIGGGESASESSSEHFDDLGGSGGASCRCGAAPCGRTSSSEELADRAAAKRQADARLAGEPTERDVDTSESRSVVLPTPESRSDDGVKKMYSLAQRGDFDRLLRFSVGVVVKLAAASFSSTWAGLQ